MEMWTEVRRRVLTGKLSKRAACREYGINWRTLGKMLVHVEPPGYRRRARREQPVLGSHVVWIQEVLEQDKQEPKKQRHTAKRIFDRLKVERGYTGGYTMVKDAVQKWKAVTKEVFVSLSHPPGEAQVDFGFAYVDVAGERQQVALFVMSLPYSDALYIQAVPRECTEAFLEGHNRAFWFIGGVPRKIRYDNSKIAVAKITGSRERQVTKEFQRLQSHYLFQTQFCLVRRANEKGHVECLVDYGRANFLMPVPKVSSLTELNETLEGRCRAELERTLRGKDGTKALLLEEERAAFLPFPAQECEARRITQAHANSLSLVRFDTNSYSVPVKYAHRKIKVVATVDDVKLVFEDQLIARRRRHWGRERFFFDPIHYLALLERKPVAFDYARPLADWQLPECLNVLQRRMERVPDGLGTREFIRVLLLLEKATLDELAAAVEYAMSLGIADADTIRVVLEHKRESPVALFCLDSRPHLKLVHVPPTAIVAYASLLDSEASI
jgi:transposase